MYFRLNFCPSEKLQRWIYTLYGFIASTQGHKFFFLLTRGNNNTANCCAAHKYREEVSHLCCAVSTSIHSIRYVWQWILVWVCMFSTSVFEFFSPAFIFCQHILQTFTVHVQPLLSFCGHLLNIILDERLLREQVKTHEKLFILLFIQLICSEFSHPDDPSTSS